MPASEENCALMPTIRMKKATLEKYLQTVTKIAIRNARNAKGGKEGKEGRNEANNFVLRAILVPKNVVCSLSTGLSSRGLVC